MHKITREVKHVSKYLAFSVKHEYECIYMFIRNAFSIKESFRNIDQ